MKARLLTGLLPITATPLTLTSSGFGPVQAAYAWMVNSEVATHNPNNTLVQSVGFWDGTNTAACSTAAGAGGGVKEANRHTYDQDFFSFVNAFTTNEITRWSIAGVTDGIQIDLVNDPIPLTWQRQIFVLIFSGIDNVAAGIAAVAVPGAVNLGFQPKFLLNASVGTEDLSYPFTAIHNAMTIGAVTATSQGSVGAGSRHLGSGQTDAYRNARIHGASTTFNYAAPWEADIDLTATGFEFSNLTGTPDGDAIIYLAFDMPNNVNVQERSATLDGVLPGDNKVAITGVGWKPQLALSVSAGITNPASAGQNNTSLSLSACDELLVQHTTHSRGSNNLSSADFSGAIKLDHGLWIPLTPTPWSPDEPLAKYDTFDADGYTLEYITAATSTARYYLEILIEENTTSDLSDIGSTTWTAPFNAVATLIDSGNATWTAPWTATPTTSDIGSTTWTAPFTAGITLTDTGNATWTAPFTATPTLADIGATTWTAPFSATPTILDSGSTTWTAPFDVGASVTDIGDTIWTAPFSAVATLTDSGNATWTAPFDATVVVGDTGISTWTALFIAIPTLADIGISTWTAPFDVGVILTDTGVSTWTAPFNVLATLLDSGVATWTAPFNATTTTTLLDTGSTTWTAPFSIELLYGAVYAEVSWVIEVQPNGIVWHPN